MSGYVDLTQYDYNAAKYYRPVTLNIGWLAVGQQFKIGEADESLLESLWNYCRVSVAELRGLHRCELCTERAGSVFQRGKDRLLLGAAEIRVFSSEDTIFAAPNLIYHYVADHRYKPPQFFLDALQNSPGPPDSAYFHRLAALNLAWRPTSAPSEEPTPVRLRPRTYS